jgi:hypothetical protein
VGVAAAFGFDPCGIDGESVVADHEVGYLAEGRRGERERAREGERGSIGFEVFKERGRNACFARVKAFEDIEGVLSRCAVGDRGTGSDDVERITDDVGDD